MAESEDTDVSLSDLQLDLMRVLWARDEASVADIAAALDDRDLAHTTVATVLTRLAKRGLVSARRDGRQFGGLLRGVFGGDPKALLAHLVDEREVNSRDLDRVRELLARKPGRKP